MRHSHQRFLDTLFVSAMILYVVAGMMLAPFHGDESTIIHKSRDWYLLLQGNLAALYYQPTPTDPAEQELRLVNGVTSAYGMGIAAMLIGVPSQDINEQWLWGADWKYNLENRHIPSSQLLFSTRLSSTLMIIVSVALVFTIARWLGGRGSAWLATLIYATMPALLLNGRRAMFEGATMLSIALVMAAGLAIARHIQWSKRGNLWIYWLLFGAVSGFGLASKHTLIVTILPIVVALLFVARRDLKRTVGYALAAGITALMIFLTLNPAWWSAPFTVPREVIRLRQNLLAGQTEFYGGYTNTQDRVVELVSAVMEAPQYYEDKHGWPEWIGPQITSYDRSGVGGIAWSRVASLALVVITGGVWLVPGIRKPQNMVVFLSVFLFSLFAIFWLTPVAWQRYYLPLAALWAIAYGLSLNAAGQVVLRLVRSRYAR
ncbi:MAG: glycosyltransferase family 39 protein [Chloroflexota bacterium]